MAANLIYMTKTAWQSLLDSIRTKAGTQEQMTASEAKTAVDGIQAAPESFFECTWGNQTSGYPLLTLKTHAIPAIGSGQFANQLSLKTLNLGEGLYYILDQAFFNCSVLESAVLPSTTISIGSSAFQNCPRIEIADIPAGVTSLSSMCLAYCATLDTLVLRRTAGVVTNPSSNVLRNTPLASGTGKIYVPQDLISAYQTATNWSAAYAAGTQFLPLEGSEFE